MKREDRSPASSPVVAYISILFPKITETFNLREMLRLKRYGVDLKLFSLMKPRGGEKTHPEAAELAEETRYGHWFPRIEVLRANLHYLAAAPVRYLKLLTRLVAISAREPATLAKTLAIFPESVHFAQVGEDLRVEHIHSTFASHNTTSALIMSELTGIGYSFTIDAYDLFIETALLEEKIRRADFVATISDYNLKVIAERYGPSAYLKTHVIRRGIDLDRFRPNPLARAALPKEPFRVVCVASYQLKKGHFFLLEAVAKLKSEGRKLVCFLVGDGPLREGLHEQIRRLGLSECVVMTGNQTQDEVITWLQKADCAVLPSIVTRSRRMEGIPNALMEAMACELPVIGTDISGVPELIDHMENGLLVQPEDPHSLAAAIALLQDDPVLGRRLGRAARQKIFEDFNLEKNVEKLYQLYCKAVSAEGI